ncbi:MAG TPA: PAS domain-containing protein, partial [Coleofasciculaceae cyanobacterium]
MPDRLHQDPEIARLYQELAQCRATLEQTQAELATLKILNHAQKQPYQYWQKIMNALPVCISYLDHNRRYCYVNHSYQRWFGFSPDKIYGKRLIDVIGQDAYQSVKLYIDRVLTGETVTYESTVPYAQGGNRYIRATLIPDI